MGLFARKKNQILDELSLDIKPIVCLSCFKKFNHDKVLFRALESLDADDYRADVDEVLDSFRALFGKHSAGLMAATLDPEDFKEVRKVYHKGVLFSLKDEFDNITSHRICPYCHNDLHLSAGLTDSIIIPVLGSPGVGKSIYYTSLIQYLKTKLPKIHSCFCFPMNPDIGKRFKENYEIPLFTEKTLIDIGKTEWTDDPLVFTLTFTELDVPAINIVLFDFGDIFYAESVLDIYSNCVNNAAGVIFLIDPTKFSIIQSKVHESDNSLPQAIVEPTDALLTYIYKYIQKNEERVSEIPLATVLSKSDRLLPLKSEGVYISTESNMFTPSGSGFFDLDDYALLNETVENFLIDMDPNFRSLLKRSFSNRGFFAVSSTGTSSTKSESGFSPLRIEDPLLWILYQLGYIDDGGEE